MKFSLIGLLAILCAIPIVCRCQDPTDANPGGLDKIANFPTKLFNKISGKTADLQQQLTRQTERYLNRMSRQEEKLRAQLYKTDSVKAAALYPQDPKQQYTAMLQKFKQDSARAATSMGPEYLARESIVYMQRVLEELAGK